MTEDISEHLNMPCIIDNSLLVNLIFSGSADLLKEGLQIPIYIPPSILDPMEIPKLSSLAIDDSLTFDSELFSTLEDSDNKQYKNNILSFLAEENNYWQRVELTEQEVLLAAHLRTRESKSDIRTKCPHIVGSVSIDPGEAEVLAVATTRSWTILIDDQGGVNAARCLYPDVPIVRTCQLLQQLAKNNIRSCNELESLFNNKIVDELDFRAYRNKMTERLTMRCNPPRCEWEENL